MAFAAGALTFYAIIPVDVALIVSAGVAPELHLALAPIDLAAVGVTIFSMDLIRRGASRPCGALGY